MPRRDDGGGFAGPLSAIAVASIALGVVVMLLAVCILRGFQRDIADKVVGFGSHLTVSNYVTNPAYQEHPVTVDSALVRSLREVPGVRHLQFFATKGGMVKTDEQIHGILLRGVSAGYDTAFFARHLVGGRLPAIGSGTQGQPSAEVLISSTIASRMKLKVGDKMRSYFWGSAGAGQAAAPRSRAFTVSGIYNTDLADFDELHVLGDLRQVQRLNGWDSTMVGGYELLVDDFGRLDATAREVLQALPYDYSLMTIRDANPALFAWLDLLNSNIVLILTIMCLVCVVAIVSALLIMIFEKGSTIGLLKALGASNAAVRRIFIIKASRLMVEGVALGEGVALALCLVQQRWAPLTLDPESYSMSHVPVAIEPATFVLVGAGTLAVCLAALLLPTTYIARINPAKTVRIAS